MIAKNWGISPCGFVWYVGAPYRGRGRGRGRGFQDPDDVKYLKNMRGHQDGVTTMIFDEASGKVWPRYYQQHHLVSHQSIET